MGRFKNILFIFLLAATVTGGYLGYQELKKSKRPSRSAIENIPAGCALYLSFSDLSETNKRFNSQNLVVEQLKGFAQINSFFDHLDTLTARLQEEAELLTALEGIRLHIAVYDEQQWLLAFAIKQLGEQDNIHQLLRKTLGNQQKDNEIELFDGRRIFTKASEGIILISNSASLLNLALSPETPKLHKQNDFKQYSDQLEGKNFLSVYVDHRTFAGSLYNETLNLSYLFKDASSCFNLTSSPSQLNFNGQADLDSAEKFKLLRDTEPFSAHRLLSLLPEHTVYFECFAAGNETIEEEFKKEKSSSDFWRTMNDKALFDLKKEFYENLTGPLMRFRTAGEAEYLVSAVADTIRAAEHLGILSDSTSLRDSLKIYRFTDQEEKPVRFFMPVYGNTVNFAAIVAGHLFLAQSESQLHQLLFYLRTGAVLSGDAHFERYITEQLSEECHYLYYTSPVASYKKPNRFFNFKGGSDTAFNKIKHLSFSITSQEKLSRCRLQLTHEARGPFNDNLWLAELDTVVNRSPRQFINHYNGEKEIVVQDAANKLYLLNAKGQILWKKKLPEQMESDLHIVDLFKNNKNQLLFNSRNYIHLIDRNGDYVEGYPVKLPAPATAPLSVYDYDNTKDYRLFIPCGNNSIYNYSLRGKPQEGFTTVKTSSEVRLPVQFAVIGDAQYLVTCDIEGKIYAFSRKGLIKVTFRNRVVKDCSALALDISQTIQNSSIVYFDEKNNLLNKIFFTDKKEGVKIASGNENAVVRFQNVDEKTHTDLLLVAADEVSAFDFSGQQLVKRKMLTEVDEALIFRNENHVLMFALNKEKGTLYKTDMQKERLEELKGNTLPLIIELFGNNKKYMVTASGSRLYCRLLK